ncbi:MAG: tRNA glutamyl-Q(34) synthetase GluQRS [Pseudomonadota bacterium]|nr:tRNA glutamyl-Q(34) synthetase GluQRS [Pseudomonadota bacterium]
MQNNKILTRFAPSPTGYLHLGHAYSAMFSERAARKEGGKFLLRIEDIDQGRCKTEYEHSIKEDLHWLGLKWEPPVRRQSEHLEDYKRALDKLWELGVVYSCFCTRRDIKNEIRESNSAPHGLMVSGIGTLYLGKCKNLSINERDTRYQSGQSFAVRLDVSKAQDLVGELYWVDKDNGNITVDPKLLGDVVIARKDIPTSYHLSVVVDDYLQNVSLVTRGNDLRTVTHIHRLLQALLDYNPPIYQFHRLLTADNGKRYAKRDKSKSLKFLRDSGESAAAIRTSLGF